MSTTAPRIVPLAFVFLAFSAAGRAADIADEGKVKREAVFEFAQKPAIAREGDKTTITFESKGFCDVTVAVEDAGGRIIRHLASGVLGPRAPEPLQKDSKKQALVWDGKTDKGEYAEDKDMLTVRVSLGLKPQFERTLFWSPKRRAGDDPSRGVAMRATPEGVYLYDGGQAVDHVRLFSHQGEYLKTVYPFPAEKVKDVKGLYLHTFAQDGRALPIKPSYQMCTLLTSGDNALNLIFKDDHYIVGPMDPCHKGEHGVGAVDLAIGPGRIAVGANRLNRLAPDGSSGGLEVYGPWICLRSTKGFYKAADTAMSMNRGGYEALTNLKPNRFVFSPDGKTLYLTRYTESFTLDVYSHNYWQHGVYRMDYAGDKEPELFLGAPESGSDAAHFRMPADVACDNQGRIYVADCGNHRVQVFQSDGKLVKTIPVEAPVQVAISPTGELYVFSWELLAERNVQPVKVEKPYTLRKFKSADDPQLLATYDLPMGETRGKYGQCATVDFWTTPVTVWISPGVYKTPARAGEFHCENGGIFLLAEKGARLERLCDFDQDAKKAVLVGGAPGSNRQRLYADPLRGHVYVGEGGFHFQQAVQIDPSSGKLKLVQLPFDAEDMCFDADGMAYLRTPTIVARYEPNGWREVPWDYGEERQKVTYNTHSSRREAKLNSGLPLPVNAGWHQGGMSVSPRGNLAVGCLFSYTPDQTGPRGQEPVTDGKKYAPQIYPGRIVNAVYGCEYVHVWDKHGKLLREDAIPGLGTLNGVGIDNQDNLYVLSAAPRALDDNLPFNFLAGTLVKFRPGKARMLSDDPRAPVPLPASERPNRPPDLSNLPGNAWAEGAEWFLGGVGWHGKNHGLGCGCRNVRFALDYFGRTFAPELDRYSVAVLDTAGNVIVRIGQYGNVDDGKPLVEAGGPPVTRSIGGDEVALMHAAYAATQTDRRLFLADIGNYRVLSVKLGYHVDESVSLKTVKDATKK